MTTKETRKANGAPKEVMKEVLKFKKSIRHKKTRKIPCRPFDPKTPNLLLTK